MYWLVMSRHKCSMIQFLKNTPTGILFGTALLLRVLIWSPRGFLGCWWPWDRQQCAGCCAQCWGKDWWCRHIWWGWHFKALPRLLEILTSRHDSWFHKKLLISLVSETIARALRKMRCWLGPLEQYLSLLLRWWNSQKLVSTQVLETTVSELIPHMPRPLWDYYLRSPEKSLFPPNVLDDWWRHHFSNCANCHCCY